MSIRTYGSHRVEVRNLDKVFFSQASITKGDLVDYYERIAKWMIPHVEGRPLSLERFPDGIDGESFFQKQTPDYFPDWVTTVSVPIKGKGGSQSQIVCDEQATLVYLANQACITPHIWLSRSDRLDVPDRMVFDLDPPGNDFAPVRAAARHTRALLSELGLESYVMLTGSKGAHVLVPLRRENGFDRVRRLARGIAARLARANPENLTTAQRKEERGKRLFLDTTRNAYGQTTVAPYAVRARPSASVATPIDWDELGTTDPSDFTIRSVFRRLAQKEDPWRDLARHAQAINEPEEKLAELEASA